MKIRILLTAMAALAAAGATAQSVVDAYSVTPSELRGTARFVGMGGAFTSVGGDLSTLGQNPAGIGIYRRSEVGATVNISARNYSTATPTMKIDRDNTKFYFDNIGYVGTANLGNNATLRSFSWGVSYSRLSSFERLGHGYNGTTDGSMTNYIASFTNGTNAADLRFGEKYNPYFDSDCDWMSILAYNAYMINGDGVYNDKYKGLYGNNTVGDAEYTFRESGHVDEYNIDFGGNISDVFYWGIGFGILDMEYNRQVYYSESMDKADIYTLPSQRTVEGSADWAMNNSKWISGTGFNVKFGVIFRPIEMLRIGAAIHTPTWYSLNHQGGATVSYDYYNPGAPESTNPDTENPLKGNDYTGDENNMLYSYDSRLNAPWRFMVGASLYIGPRAIVSLDYERVAYDAMRVKSQSGYYGLNFESNEYVNSDIKNYYKGANIVRLGAEYRVTPRFSVRAGYNYQTSGVKDAARNGDIEVVTAGTDLSYNFTNTTQNISFGLGYRYKAWYIDATYSWRHRTGSFHAYTDYAGIRAPKADLTENNHNVVLSTGFRF